MQRVRVQALGVLRLVNRKLALEPSPCRPNYIHLRSLAAQIRVEASRRFRDQTELSIADVGCGTRPYEELFAPFVSEYVGIDHREGPGVDVVASAEDLPFEAARFDGVVSTQMLEHAEDPAAVVNELSRVLKPGGQAFVSTHGVMVYHPNPDDYWRWTHAGLERLFRLNGDWSSVDVYPNGGTGSALAYLTGHVANLTAGVLGGARAVKPLVFAINVLGWNLDRIDRRMLSGRPPHLAPSYLVVATRE